MTEIKFTPAQGNWLEVTWTDVVQAPDVVVPAKPALYDADGNEVQPAVEASTEPGQITRTELKHVSYHPTQLDMLQADAEAMGTSLDEYAEMLAEWVADYVPPPPEPVPVPQSVTMRQARLALLMTGRLSQVAGAIELIQDEGQKQAAKIEWEYSQEVQRNHWLINGLSVALGMTPADVDDLFIIAGGL